MKQLYCVICSEYRKFEKPKIYIFEKTFVLSIICSKHKKEESIKVLKILDLIENI